MDQAEAAGATALQMQLASRQACKVIDVALRDTANQMEPTLWLQRAVLMQMDPHHPDHVKLHAIERATRMAELALQNDFAGLDFHHDMHLGCMLGLAHICESKREPELALRLLDIIDTLDPDCELSVECRGQLRERCTPISVQAYIAPPHRDAVSPSAVPPSILKR